MPPSGDLRVVLDARFIGFAGIGRWVEGIWRGLIENGVDVIALWPAGPPRDWMGAKRPPAAGPTIEIAARPFLPTEQVALPRVLRRLEASLHHAPNWAVPYFTHRPVVLTVHDLYPYLIPTLARSRLTAAAYRTLVPLAVRKARRLVAVSPLAARQLVDTFHIGEDRLRLVEHGIDHARFHPPTGEEVAAVRERYELPTDYLLYVGTLKTHKNLATLLAAHGSEHPPLVMAGPTASELQRSELAERIDGTVLAIGRVQDELPALYGGAIALVMPSLYESVGFPALEAMACGTAVVCSDGGALPEVVGEDGLVVPVRDVAAWREALSMISQQTSLRVRLADGGRRRVSGRSWREAARQYLDIYREVT